MNIKNNKKTILITGASGFIGRNLKTFFNSKYELLTPRSFELNCVNGQEVKNYFENNKIDFIIHCGSVGGARGIKDKDTTLHENVKMVENLLQYRNENCKIILFSSGAMYDKSKPIQKVKESEFKIRKPYDLYGKSKNIIAKYVENKKNVICLNIFACYGYDEKETRFPSYAIIQNLKKENIIINQNVVFDYLFIEDLCKIVDYFLINTPKNNIINVTPTKSIELLEIAKIVNKIGDNKSDINIKNSNLGNEYTGDNSRLLNEYKDIKFTDIEIGLKKLYEYIKYSK